MDWEAMLERVAREAAKEQWPGYSHGQDVFLPRYIAVLRRELLPVLEAGHIAKHYECEDGFYSCPKAEGYFGTDSETHCSCGKDEYDAALANLARGEEKR